VSGITLLIRVKSWAIIGLESGPRRAVGVSSIPRNASFGSSIFEIPWRLHDSLPSWACRRANTQRNRVLES